MNCTFCQKVLPSRKEVQILLITIHISECGQILVNESTQHGYVVVNAISFSMLNFSYWTTSMSAQSIP